jgi:hypothetical protein
MRTLSIASGVSKDARVFGEATAPWRGIARLRARLRAMASVGGRSSRRKAMRPNQRPWEMDPIARLTRDYPFFFAHLPF